MQEAQLSGSALTLQREVGRLLAPIWVPLIAVLLRWRGYRIEAVEQSRRQYQQIRRKYDGPLLICANHLTLIDSAIVAWALGSPWWLLRNYSALPWNVPERQNFASWWLTQAISYVMKCVPITRGGSRGEVAQTLARLSAVLGRGEVALVFPEGGRSRSGRVDVESVAYGVGYIVNSLPGCRVLCVYLRGHGQTGFSELPARGEHFCVALELITPKTSARGLRADRDVARQIIGQLAAMERQYFEQRTPQVAVVR
ncbi:MAG: 1-acyl-sn-glycerol-3-phosphate acyltransferase [Deltaproteobacteria bacterium]|nr:1-acyl-sn-glycerol-3-phosphate acyltransferase [Deltaproteobacteria bacterium]MBI3388305.1 1-acyl-sn-glycerol-3-phosphate acyltransferase [Deltaproteobacteria bacterium]